jgi:DDE superfamily endonuclease/Helix-turn-helix of DDE superfamily endonuclease
LRTQRTTGLTVEQFAELCHLVFARVQYWSTGIGRPRSLTLGEAVKVTVMYEKNNMTEEVLSELFGVSQPTISRVITKIEPIIAEALGEFVLHPEDAPDSIVVLVDGTLTPCWSWADAPELRSGKHKTTGHNHQVGATLTGRLLFITDSLPGKTHDVRAFRENGLGKRRDRTNGIGDKGYLGSGMLTPFRKPPGGELLPWQKEFNTAVNSLRAPVERAIANVKVWRILHTDFRRPLKSYETAFQAVRGLIFFRASFEL